VSSRVRLALQLGTWWCLLFLGYLGLISLRPWPEWVMGALIAAAIAVVGVLSQRAFDVRVRPPAQARRLLLLPVDLGHDTVALVRLLLTGRVLRSDPGRTDHVALPQDSRLRAWTVLLVSASPGSLAVDLDHDGQDDGDHVTLRRHALTRPGRTAPDRTG
jgi:hypothetical protein